MKTVQCAHPPHHHNGFVATWRLWTASGGVHALLVLEPTAFSKLKVKFMLKSWSERGTYYHPAFMDNCPTLSHTFLSLSTQWMSSPSRK